LLAFASARAQSGKRVLYSAGKNTRKSEKARFIGAIWHCRIIALFIFMAKFHAIHLRFIYMNDLRSAPKRKRSAARLATLRNLATDISAQTRCFSAWIRPRI
jgi:hypothetical protein